MRIFVAGATGAVGQRLIPPLVSRGHQVTATTRRAVKLEGLRALGAEAVVVDGLDALGVGEAVARARPDAVVHQMTALAGPSDLRRFDRWFAATNELRTRGTQHLLAAARASGVKRFVAQSYSGWTNLREGGPTKSESDPFDPQPARNQVETLRAIQFLEQAVLEAPLEGVVLRYANFYGRGASDSLLELVRRRSLPLIGEAGGVWSWIHLDDAASATVAALERACPGVYNVADDEPAPVAAWLPYLADLVRARQPMRVPVWLARILAGEVAVRWMTEGRGSSNEKIKRTLGWQPRWPSWRDGFRQLVAGDSKASNATRLDVMPA